MKNVAVIGAGIAGLTAGIYARQSGFEVTIYESHTIPGGASTSWRRKGYLFEGGIHWMTGSSKDAALNRLWREVGALDDSVRIYKRDPFFTFEYMGKTALLYSNTEKLRRHLTELAPEDEKEIKKFTGDIKKFINFSMPVTDIKGVKVKRKSTPGLSALFGLIRALPKIPYYSNQSAKEYAARFKNPLMRNLIENIIGPEYSAIGMIATLATLAAGDGGYPEGGSLAMAARIAKKFTDLGGRIEYGKAVSKVWIEGGVAKGIVVDGEKIAADAVIVTQDTRVAIDNLFDTPIKEPWAEKMRQKTKPSLDTFICVGVETDLSKRPEHFVYVSDEPLKYGNFEERVISINNYSRYKNYAPEGCTAITSFYGSDSYDFWKSCKENGTYEAEKQKLAEAFIALLAKKYPETEGKVKVWDVATPLTYERYLHSYKGSWMSVTGKGEKMENYPSKPDSIKNVYFAGQRIMPPGGLPAALDTGRKAVQHLCMDTDTVFQGNI